MTCIEHDYHDTVGGYMVIQRNYRRLIVHRLLCAMTHNLPYDGEWEARHTCDNKRCIRIEHLIPGTHADNMQDARERGLIPKGERHHASKLTDEQAALIRADTRRQRVIAEDYGVSQATVSQIKTGWSR